MEKSHSGEKKGIFFEGPDPPANAPDLETRFSLNDPICLPCRRRQKEKTGQLHHALSPFIGLAKQEGERYLVVSVLP